MPFIGCMWTQVAYLFHKGLFGTLNELKNEMFLLKKKEITEKAQLLKLCHELFWSCELEQCQFFCLI